ncbi:MAG: class I SAM-dependent methyltransferase [Solirubrobacteraceae bacterium]
MLAPSSSRPGITRSFPNQKRSRIASRPRSNPFTQPPRDQSRDGYFVAPGTRPRAAASTDRWSGGEVGQSTGLLEGRLARRCRQTAHRRATIGVVTRADEQGDVVRREFSRQAASFEAAGSLFRDTSVLDWIAAHVPVSPGARILDVAGGTGQLGRYLARDGAIAVIVDLTDAMLATGLRAVLDEGRDDVVFVRGDAIALPFPADEFDVVVCRFALHHIQECAAAIAEMARLCRPGGMVAVIDMVDRRALIGSAAPLVRLRSRVSSCSRRLSCRRYWACCWRCLSRPRLRWCRQRERRAR